MLSILALTLVQPAISASITVEGEGYLRFAQEGRIVYAKSARLISSEGRIKSEDGASAMPLLTLPQGAAGLRIERDGTVSVQIGGESKILGKILLALFETNEALAKQGNFLVAKSRPRLAVPGSPGIGTIVQLGSRSENIAISSTANQIEKGAVNDSFKSIELMEKVTLSTSRMTVDQFVKGDIASEIRDRLRTADFGPAPRSGFATKITKARVQSKLITSGFNLSMERFIIPELIEVRAPSQEVAPETFIQAALEACTLKFGNSLELKVSGKVEPFQAPIGTLELKSEAVAEQAGQILVTISIWVDGIRCNSKQISFTGGVPAIAVKAGEVVKVVMRASGIALETSGRVKKAARIGEFVEVEVMAGDPPAKSTHLGKVTAPGRIEVTL